MAVVKRALLSQGPFHWSAQRGMKRVAEQDAVHRIPMQATGHLPSLPELSPAVLASAFKPVLSSDFRLEVALGRSDFSE